MSANQREGRSNILHRSHSCKLELLHITNFKSDTTYDIRGVFNELNIYSSIDGVITSGDVSIIEQGNLIDLLPLDGREFIEICFNSDDDKYDPFHRLFFIYAVDNILEVKDKRHYVIRFTDVMGMINPNCRLSISYKNKKVEDIIDSVRTAIENPESGFEVYKQILADEKRIKALPTQNLLFPFTNFNELSVHTEYNMNFVVPQWHPIKFIKYITDRALSQDSVSLLDNKFADCVFFQNRKGEFVLTNYKRMFNTKLTDKAGKPITFKRAIANAITEKREVDEFIHHIVSLSYKDLFNVQKEKQLGFFGFTAYITDFSSAKVEEKKVSAEDIYNCLDKYGLTLENPIPFEALQHNEKAIFYYDVGGINWTYDYMDVDRYVLPYLKGNVLRSQMEYVKVTLEMNGIPDIDLGKYVYINVGTHKNNLESFVEGTKWVVSKYSHRILCDGTYTTAVECFTPYANRKYENTFIDAWRD